MAAITRRHLFECAGAQVLHNRGNYLLYEVVNDRYIPRLKLMTPGKVWIDSNNDGLFDQHEVISTAYKGSGGFGGYIDEKMNLYTYEGWGYPSQGHAECPKSSIKILRWNFLGFNAQGGLQYSDPMKFDQLAAETTDCCVSDICSDPDGSVYVMIATRNLKRGETRPGIGTSHCQVFSEREKAVGISECAGGIRLECRRLYPGIPGGGHALFRAIQQAAPGRDRLLRAILPAGQAGWAVYRCPGRGPAWRLHHGAAHGADGEFQRVHVRTRRENLFHRRRCG